MQNPQLLGKGGQKTVLDMDIAGESYELKLALLPEHVCGSGLQKACSSHAHISHDSCPEPGFYVVGLGSRRLGASLEPTPGCICSGYSEVLDARIRRRIVGL